MLYVKFNLKWTCYLLYTKIWINRYFNTLDDKISDYKMA